MITQQELKEIIFYNPDTGLFTWLKRRSQRVLAGDNAGSIRKDGYHIIVIDGKYYYGHRLAWFYMKGEWVDEIDHEDTNPSNNKWINLRESTHSQNKGNIKKHSNNKSGYKGVSWAKNNGKWVVYIKVGTMRKNLGYYVDKEIAAKVYAEAAAKYFGEFART